MEVVMEIMKEIIDMYDFSTTDVAELFGFDMLVFNEKCKGVLDI